MELFLLARQIEVDSAADAVLPPARPLVQDLPHAHNAGISGDEDIEIAGEGVQQRRELIELCHYLLGIGAALEIDGELQAAQVRLIAHIADLAELARLDELGDLVDDRLAGGGIRDLIDLDDVLLRHKAPARPHLHAAASGAVDLAHLRLIEQHLAARREVRCGQGGENVVLGVLQQLDRGLADLLEIKSADLARHADGNAGVRRDKHVRERRRQQRRLLHGAVVVVHEVHGVAVDVAEELIADRRELGFGVTGGRPCHIAGVDLAEVALGIHKGRQQRAVALGKAHHRIVDRGVAVRV